MPRYSTKASLVYAAEDELNPDLSLPDAKKPPVRVQSRPFGQSFSSQTTDSQLQRRVTAYLAMDTPWGFANKLSQEDPNIAMRVFLLDNSGSTSECDGHVLRTNHRGELQSMPATRWEEICDMALAHAEWNARAGVRSEFVLLNPPCPKSPVEGRDYAVVNPSAGNPTAQVQALVQILMNNGPRGVTPLAARIQQIRSRLEREVREDGRRIMLTIVTDGLPTAHNGTPTRQDQNMLIDELRHFTAALNSFVVVRLATDDDDTVDFYNKIDEELELPLDILDDLRGEAQEVYANKNGWFAYTPLIHKIREGGTLEKLFDLMDERALRAPEIALLLELLFRRSKDPPFPRDPTELYRIAKEKVVGAQPVYNGRLDRMSPPVDLKLLKKALGLTPIERMKSLPARVRRAILG